MFALIESWRSEWHDDFPFYFVEIAPFTYFGNGRSGPKKADSPDREALFWEQQTDALQIPHTGMVVTTDITDNVHDHHPRDKRSVGERLAAWALAKDYGHPPRPSSTATRSSSAAPTFPPPPPCASLGTNLRCPICRTKRAFPLSPSARIPIRGTCLARLIDHRHRAYSAEKRFALDTRLASLDSFPKVAATGPLGHLPRRHTALPRRDRRPLESFT